MYALTLWFFGMVQLPTTTAATDFASMAGFLTTSMTFTALFYTCSAPFVLKSIPQRILRAVRILELCGFVASSLTIIFMGHRIVFKLRDMALGNQ